MEMCVSRDLVVSNTFFEHRPEEQVTCYNVGSRPSDPAMPEHFGQIDFLLASRELQEHVCDIYSVRGAALASHHFLLQCYVRMDIPKVALQHAARLDVAAF